MEARRERSVVAPSHSCERAVDQTLHDVKHIAATMLQKLSAGMWGMRSRMKQDLAYAACSVVLRFATNGALDSLKCGTASPDVGEA